MDAHLFRRLCMELAPLLMGVRMEKIHALSENVLIFTLYGGHSFGGKRYLVFKFERQAPFLFLSEHRVPSGLQPPAFVMRLRKHLSDRRIERVLCDWSRRRLLLGTDRSSWLCLDLREGASLSFEEPLNPEEPMWPSFPVPADGGEFRDVLTPALRRTLRFLEEPDAAALLMDLQDGGGDLFLYAQPDGRKVVSAWPLPSELQAEGMEESVFQSALPALEQAGEEIFLSVAEEARRKASHPFSVEVGRLDRLLNKLDTEEIRLGELKAQQEDALILQSNLWRFGAHEKLASVKCDSSEGTKEIFLDPKLTVRENMREMFRQAARGRRGLEFLIRRREEVRRRREAAEEDMLRATASVSGEVGPRQKVVRNSALPKHVQVFRSSDGFPILRGRDTKGNALALKSASPHDYWLHTAEGPSAHVIIRRAHAKQEVPLKTMREAGALVASKSWQKDQKSVLIQYSLAKFIHPMKNADPGTVRIDRSEGTFLAVPDPETERRLGEKG